MTFEGNLKKGTKTPYQGNPELVKKPDDDDRLPIHWAVSQGHTEVVKLLLDSKKFDDVDVKVSSHRIDDFC